MKKSFGILFLVLFSSTLFGCDLQSAAPLVERDTASTASPEESTEVKGFRYEEYSEARFNALKGKQPIILNFHADWCPKCRALDESIQANREDFPEDVVMFDVDYDTYHGLKQAYGITIQTTLVFFDRNGEQVAKEYNPSIAKLKDLMAQL